MAAWRYYAAHNKKSDTVVKRQKRTDIKIYKLHDEPHEGEKIYMFSVDHVVLRTWSEQQEVI